MPTLNLTWYQLEQLGLAVCNHIECGHPPSNHFAHGKKRCGRDGCKCKGLARVICLPRRTRPAAPSGSQSATNAGSKAGR